MESIECEEACDIDIKMSKQIDIIYKTNAHGMFNPYKLCILVLFLSKCKNCVKYQQPERFSVLR